MLRRPLNFDPFYPTFVLKIEVIRDIHHFFCSKTQLVSVVQASDSMTASM